MIYRVEVLPRGAQDLREIRLSIGVRVSRDAADWFLGLRAIIRRLDQNPGRGSVTPENPVLRELSYGKRPRSYRIIYKIDEDRRLVSVLHIRHGARDRFPPELGA